MRMPDYVDFNRRNIVAFREAHISRVVADSTHNPFTLGIVLMSLYGVKHADDRCRLPQHLR